MAKRYRQEVLNVILAELLQERGLVAAPEQITRAISNGSKRMPDVLVDFQGLRLAIEGEFGGRAASTEKASAAALGRVEQGIAHVGVAVLYPVELRSPDFDQLRSQLRNSRLQFAIITETKVTEQQQLTLFPLELEKKEKQSIQFMEGDLDNLADALRHAYEQLIEDEVLQRAVAMLESSIDRFIGALGIQPATTNRFSDALGIREFPKVKKKKGDAEKEE